jgi:tripartite-type tricarboxylate transporter receptor subunit TctC
MNRSSVPGEGTGKLVRWVGAIALACCCSAVTGAERAQSYPLRPIRIILPFGPGGVTDITARAFAQRLSESIQQQVIIDNRPSAGGIVATEMAMKAEPDGYTLLWLNSGHAVSVAMMKSLPYDPVRDFVPISSIGFFGLAIAVNADSSVKSVPQLIASAKTSPAKFNFGITNVGSTNHVAAELFKSMTGLGTQVVPFKTTPALLGAARSNEASAIFEFIAPVLPHVKSGALRAIAVTTDRRYSGLPDVPTVAEAGHAGYEASAWNSLAAPVKTPRAIIERLNREVNAIVATADFKQRLLEMSIEARGSTPNALHALLVAEIAKWKSVVEKAKIERQ